jgi:hypothetical protein
MQCAGPTSAAALVQLLPGYGHQLGCGRRHATDGLDGRDAPDKAVGLVPRNVLDVGRRQCGACHGRGGRGGAICSLHNLCTAVQSEPCGRHVRQRAAALLTQPRQPLHARQAQVPEAEADPAPGHQVEHLAQLAAARGG